MLMSPREAGAVSVSLNERARLPQVQADGE